MLFKKLPKNYVSLISASFLSNIGNYAHEIVFVLLTIQLTNENYTLIGLIYFIRFLPYLIFGFFGGTIADSYDKKKIMLISDLARMVLSILLFILLTLNNLNVIVLMIISFSFTFFKVFFQPAMQAIIPAMVKKENLRLANSLNQGAIELSSIIGPLICTLIIYQLSKKYVFMLDGITYFSSLILIMLLKFPKIKGNTRIKFTFIETYNQSLKQIILVINDKNLFTTIFSSSICIFLVASLLRFILPSMIVKYYTNDAIVGYMMAFISFGTIVGAILFNRLKFKANNQKLLIFWSLYGLIFFCIAISNKLYLMFSMGFILGIFGAFVDIIIVCNIQNYSNTKNLGKNFSVFSTLANIGESFSAIVAGWLASVSLLSGFVIMSFLTIVIPLIFYLSHGTFNKFISVKE